MRFSILISFLLLLPFAHALDCITDASTIIFSEQGTLLVGVIIFTFILIIIAYLAGTAIGNANFIVFAKDEAWHLGFSLAILVCFSAILYFSCSAIDMFYKTTLEEVETSSACYSETATMTGVSLCYLSVAKLDAQRMSELYIDNYIGYLMDSTWSVTISIPLTNSFTSAAGAWRRVVSSQYDLVLNMFLFPALLSLSMQELFLGFVSDSIIQWLLPIAFLLRIFIPTRGMGNMLIALSVALYLVVPFVYTFNLAMYDAIPDEECLSVGGAVNDRWFGSCLDYGSFWDVAKLMPQAFFLPNLTIALLITFLAGANKALRVIG